MKSNKSIPSSKSLLSIDTKSKHFHLSLRDDQSEMQAGSFWIYQATFNQEKSFFLQFCL